MNVIRSHKHEIYTETINKIALSANDDKQIILPDKIQTNAYGFRAKPELQALTQTEVPRASADKGQGEHTEARGNRDRLGEQRGTKRDMRRQLLLARDKGGQTEVKGTGAQ